MKTDKRILALTCAIILLPVLFGAAMWARLPETMATHWGVQGEPDGYSSRAFTVFGIPVILMLLQLLCAWGGQRGKWAQSEKMHKFMLWIIPLVSLLCMGTVYAWALGARMYVGRIVMTFVGVMFMVIGNYLPKFRQNPTMGIKLPWTLSDEENWNKTHRFAAPLWVLGGAYMMMTGLTGFGGQWDMIAMIALMVALPTGYSYRLAKKKGA